MTAYYRIGLAGPEGSSLIMTVPLVGDPEKGARFDPDAPGPHLVRMVLANEVWYGELDVDVDEDPVVTYVQWGQAFEDYDGELDLFAAPVRVGRTVRGRSLRREGDSHAFALRSISRL